jgi:hypothetical protein
MPGVLDPSATPYISRKSARHGAVKRLHFGINTLTVRAGPKAVDLARGPGRPENQGAESRDHENIFVEENYFDSSLHRCTSSFNNCLLTNRSTASFLGVYIIIRIILSNLIDWRKNGLLLLCLLNLGGKSTSLYRKFFTLKIPSMRPSTEIHLRPRSPSSRRFNCLIQSSSCSIIFGSIMS